MQCDTAIIILRIIQGLFCVSFLSFIIGMIKPGWFGWLIKNKLSRKKLVLIFLFSLVFFILLHVFAQNIIFKTVCVINTPILNPADFGVNETFTYSGFRFPFKLSEEQVSQSLMDGEPITVKNVKWEWSDSIGVMASQDGWKEINFNFYSDGGSYSRSYFKSKDVPAVEIFFHWDMSKGGYEDLTVRFIHPAKIGSWLLKIRSEKAITGETLDVESLMQCDGIISETRPDFTECIKK